MKQVIILTSIFLFLSGCAGQRLPEGGPVDSTPPEIISVYPAPNTVNYSGDRVIFEFNEYVDRRSMEEAVFISPSIQEKEFNWSGTEVEIIFHEELKKNTTYVITVGTDVKDVRAGNTMAKAFSLSFSTGEKIDNGAMRGKVHDEKPDGVMIFSYRLNNIQPDTLNPVYSKPDYITQTGKDGSFNLTNLAAGTYRLFAIRDEYRNLLYDPETDAAGTTEDVTVTETDTLITDIKFIVAKEDTTPPRIISANAADKHHVVVQFNEALDSTTIVARRFLISDTLRQHYLPVWEVFPNGAWNSFTVVTDSQQADELYLLTVDSLKDMNGFLLSPLGAEKLFKGSGVNDTVPPLIVFSSAKDSLSKILPDAPVVFMFSDALQKPLADSIVEIKNVRNNITVPFLLRWLSPASFLLQPQKSLNINDVYSVTLRWEGIRDLLGNNIKDSVSVLKFSVEDPEQFGSIEGSFTGFKDATNVVICAKNIADKKQPPIFVSTDSAGKFTLTLLPQGNYTLEAFNDKNGNRKHDAGRVFPFALAEKFALYNDTIRVRPRWPVEGVIFRER